MNLCMGRFRWLGAMAVLIGLLVGVTHPAAGVALSDAEKLQTVYRMYRDYRKEFEDVPDMAPTQAMALQADGRLIFVDLRRPEEMAVSMLPGAIPRDDFVRNLQAYRNVTVVAYCTISYRSGLFAQQMRRQGIPVFNLAGGLLAWVLEGGRVYDRQGPTRRIHVYGPRWNYPPRGYDAVMFGILDRILP